MDLQITRQNILYKIKTLEKQLLDERKKLKRLVIEEAEQVPFLEDLEKDLEACTVYTHLAPEKFLRGLKKSQKKKNKKEKKNNFLENFLRKFSQFFFE